MKMTNRKNLKKAAGILGIVTIILLASIAMVSMDIFKKPVEAEDSPDEPSYPKDHLSVDASYLLKTGETNESVNVTCDLYITNIWEKESGEIKATAYVSEQNNNFATFKSSAEFGVIDANSTKEINIPVKFMDDSYKVEILIFENNKLIKKVTLSITVYQNYYYGKGGVRVLNIGRTIEQADNDGMYSLYCATPNIHTIN